MFFLPSGRATQNEKEYLEAWRLLANGIERILPSYRVAGWNPGFLLHHRKGGHSFDLPTNAAIELLNNLG
jgi:hypothetical protein